ncbi:MAG: EAL domain-containing protein, partial [Pseudomonadota bacterium]
LEISYIKLDNQVATAIVKDKTVRDKLQGLVAEANESNTHVIAPPVENTSDLAMLWQVGITLVQDQFAGED